MEGFGGGDGGGSPATTIVKTSKKGNTIIIKGPGADKKKEKVHHFAVPVPVSTHRSDHKQVSPWQESRMQPITAADMPVFVRADQRDSNLFAPPERSPQPQPSVTMYSHLPAANNPNQNPLFVPFHYGPKSKSDPNMDHHRSASGPLPVIVPAPTAGTGIQVPMQIPPAAAAAQVEVHLPVFEPSTHVSQFPSSAGIPQLAASAPHAAMPPHQYVSLPDFLSTIHQK